MGPVVLKVYTASSISTAAQAFLLFALVSGILPNSPPQRAITAVGEAVAHEVDGSGHV
jgi:hypothetical protein